MRDVLHYQILDRLGAGGMGVVYRALDRKLDRVVALKFLPPAVTDDVDARARLVHEARAAARLDHPHIGAVYGIEGLETEPFIVLAYYEGQNLEDRLIGGPLEYSEAVDLALQAARGLEVAHRHGITHRDVKPANLLVTPEGVLKVLDFGLARWETLDALTRPGQVIGTPAYLAPEQVRGQAADQQTDLWALGAVLYEMLTGVAAFGSTAGLAATLLHIVHDEPEPIDHLRDGAPAALQAIVERALCKERDGRYASAGEMIADLRAVSWGDAATFVTAAARIALAREYAAEPQDETLELVERLKRGEAPEKQAPPAPRTHGDSEATRKHNLPLDPTPFIGRKATKARAAELLHEPTRRLLTLVGPGGIGKTRLAIEVARAHIDRYEDGVYFTNLAPVTTPDHLITAIADAIGFAFHGAANPKEQLFAFLRDKHLLLVLDNFEQLVTAAPLVAELLGFAPKLRVLATSRAALNLYGEQVYEVPTLGLPRPGETPSLESMSQYEAVALFIERALAVKPDFQITNENAPAVAEICHRLDGLALAIELAAARTKLFPPQALLGRLRSRLQTLTGGAQDLPTRQRTLRNTIDWGYDLLPAAEQKLFARLSVFVDGCSLEAIEAVCDPKHDLAIDLLEGVDSLVSKNLLRQEELRGEPRFTMLETIHEYAQEKLHDSQDAAAIKQAHANFYLRLVEEAEPHLTGPEQVAWLGRLEVDQDNLRTVAKWTDESGETETALRLAAGLYKYWRYRGYLSEGRAWLAKVLARTTAIRTAARGTALHGAGTLAWLQGDYLSASEFYAKSLEVRRELGDTHGIAHTLHNQGGLAAMQGDFALARSLLEESLAMKRVVGNPTDIASSIFSLGVLAYREGDDALARALFEECLIIFRRSGNAYSIAETVHNLGQAAFRQGDHSLARSSWKESLSLWQNLRRIDTIADSLQAFAQLHTVGGKPEEAARLYGAAEALYEMTDSPLETMDPVNHEREVEAIRAQLDERSFREAWAQGRAMSLEEALNYAPPED